MPQPYKDDFTFNSNALAKRPKLAQHVGIIVALWAEVDLGLAMLLAAILRTDAQIALAMFTPVRSEAARLSIIEAVAKERLTPKLLAEYMALRKRVKGTGDERDRVVHGLWALPKNKQKTIILVDHTKTIEIFTHVYSELAKRMDFGRKKPSQKTRNLFVKKLVAIQAGPHVLKYSAKDFVQIEKNIKTRLKEIKDFHVEVIRQFLPLRKAPRPRKSPSPTP